MALPPGWAETSITSAAVTLEFTLELKAQSFAGSADARVDHLWFEAEAAPGGVDQGHTGLWNGTGTNGVSYDLMQVRMTDQITLASTVVATGSGTGSGEPAWMTAITIEKEWSGLTLGVTIQEGVLKYAWFWDSGSTLVHRVNGSTVTSVTGASAALTPDGWQGPFIGFQVYPGQGPMLSFEAAPFNNSAAPSITGQSTYTHVKFSVFTANGAAVTPPFSTEFFATVVTSENSLRLMAHSWAAPFKYTANVDCDETSGSAVAANFTSTDGFSGVCPATPTASVLFFDGSGFDSGFLGHVVPAVTLTDPWLAAQTVRPYTADLTFRFEGNTPLDPTETTLTDWSIGDLTITSPVNVLNSSNAWTSDLGTVVITGTPTVPIFTVSAEPCRVIRNLAESWRDWINPISGDFEADDGGVTTKHDFYASGASDDAWGWGLFALCDIDMTVPAGDDTQIAVTITWAILKGSSGTSVDTIERTYSTDVAGNPIIFPAGGRSTQRIDLMFPVELAGRPFYGERVDQIRILGLQTGATTLHDITLVADEDAYVTAMGRRAVLRDGTTVFSGVVLSQDGAAPSLLWGRDAPVSPLAGDLDLDGWADYRGDHQNGNFLLNGVTKEFPGKAPGMLASTVEDTFSELDRMEGLSATYDDTAIVAAFTDGDGNEVGLDAAGLPEPWTDAVPADCFVPTLPADRIAANTPYDVRAQLVVEGVVIPAGVVPASLVIFQRNHLGMVLEGLATNADYFRQGAGVTVTARAYTGGAPAPGDTVLGTDTTDASGYGILGVRSGTIGGSQASFYLS